MHANAHAHIGYTIYHQPIVDMISPFMEPMHIGHSTYHGGAIADHAFMLATYNMHMLYSVYRQTSVHAPMHAHVTELYASIAVQPTDDHILDSAYILYPTMKPIVNAAI